MTTSATSREGLEDSQTLVWCQERGLPGTNALKTPRDNCSLGKGGSQLYMEFSCAGVGVPNAVLVKGQVHIHSLGAEP